MWRSRAFSGPATKVGGKMGPLAGYMGKVSIKRSYDSKERSEPGFESVRTPHVIRNERASGVLYYVPLLADNYCTVSLFALPPAFNFATSFWWITTVAISNICMYCMNPPSSPPQRLFEME